MIDLPLGPLMVDVACATLDSEERQFLASPEVGAVILFSRNFQSQDQLKDLISEIKQIRNPSLLVAVDQEGGRVQRFQDGFTKLPPVRIFGKLFDDDPAEARTRTKQAGYLMAAELRQTGVDFSFAPVLDCANPSSKVIGDRGFHENPEIIAELATAYISGMNLAGMKCTGKHFPGHGFVSEDSHFETPEDPRPMEDLLKRDLLPYQILGNQLNGIMTAHILYKNIDNNIPAFSPYWLKTILRGTLAFEGIIFSDDLSMEGAVQCSDITSRVRSALSSGCDMALICNDPEGARCAVMELQGEIEMDQSRFLSMSPVGVVQWRESEQEAAKEAILGLV